jgi:hypothetical protein
MGLGFVDIEPGSFRINGTDFSAVTRSGQLVKGRFTSVDDAGLPVAFTYEVSGPGFRVEGTLQHLDKTKRKYDCLLGCWEDSRLSHRIRIRVGEQIMATEADANRFFKPSDFLESEAVVAKITVVSNMVRHELLPSGQLRPFEVDLPRERSFLSRVGWIAVVAAGLAGTAKLWSRFKNKQTK